MIKLEAKYLPEKYYLDKYSMPLEQKIASIVKKKLVNAFETKDYFVGVPMSEVIEETVFEVINYLKPKVKK